MARKKVADIVKPEQTFVERIEQDMFENDLAYAIRQSRWERSYVSLERLGEIIAREIGEDAYTLADWIVLKKKEFNKKHGGNVQR